LEWLLEWYNDYKNNGAWSAHDITWQPTIEKAQEYLCGIIEQLMQLSEDERLIAFEHFE